MSTNAQILANQQNAQKSTGPTSEAGKQASSQNAAKHGLSYSYDNAQFFLLPEENREEYHALFARLCDEHQPDTETEIILVRNAAHHEWLRARAIRFQDRCFFEGMNIPAKEHFALYMRYELQHERAFVKCLNDLAKLREQKRKEQIGFVSFKQKQQAETRANETLKLRKERLELAKEALQIRKERFVGVKKHLGGVKIAA
jgi:hypothetical protein